MKQYYTGDAGVEYFQYRRHTRVQWVQAIQAKRVIGRLMPRREDVIVDLGCGTGGILANIPCGTRIGVEISETAAREAREKGIQIVQRIEELPDDCADGLISHHALEHLEEPLQALRHCLRVLRPGARAVIVVPAEHPWRRGRGRWSSRDMNHHLYCWNAQTLGNVLMTAGFELLDARVVLGIGYTRYGRVLSHIPGLRGIVSSLVAILRVRYETWAVVRRPVSTDGFPAPGLPKRGDGIGAETRVEIRS